MPRDRKMRRYRRIPPVDQSHPASCVFAGSGPPHACISFFVTLLAPQLMNYRKNFRRRELEERPHDAGLLLDILVSHRDKLRRLNPVRRPP